MTRFIKTIIKLFTISIDIGFIAGSIELIRDKVGWVTSHTPKGVYEANFKRPLDLALSLFALIVLSPLFLIVAIAIVINLGTPILFIQDRPGLDGRVFKMYKFRTMTEERNTDGNLLPDEARLTPFGKILRKTSLDELPELINIIKGDMSIVGPRPLLTEYLPRYSEEQLHRHDVRPGLTGYAQVNGRNSISWEEKFKDDVWYVDHISFFNDVKIIIKTIIVVLTRKGISSDTSATMEYFQGND